MDELGIKKFYEKAYQYEEEGAVSEAENVYCKLLQEKLDFEQKWLLYCVLLEFYRKHHMFLKMERIAKEVIVEYPESYYGYHIRFVGFVERNRYNEAELYLQNMDSDIKRTSQYIKDCIWLYELQNEYEKAEKCLEILVLKYADIDAMTSMAILLVAKGYYDRAYALVDIMLDSGGKGLMIYEYYARLIQTMAILQKNRQREYVMNKKAMQFISEFETFVDNNKLQCKDAIEIISKFKEEIMHIEATEEDERWLNN